MSYARCRACRQPLLWTTLKATGKRMPLNPEAIARPRVGLVAYNSDTQGGRVLSSADVDRALEWATKAPITFHTAHFYTCPHAKEMRRRDAA